MGEGRTSSIKFVSLIGVRITLFSFFIIPWLIGVKLNAIGGQSISFFFGMVGLICVFIFSKDSSTHLSISRLLLLATFLAALTNAVIGWIQFSEDASILICCIAQTSANDIFGNLRQRNQLASLLVLGWFSLFFFHSSWTCNKYLFVTELFAVSLLTSVLALTSSRTGAVQCMVLFSLYLTWRKRFMPRVIHFVVLGLFIYIFTAYFTLEIATWMGSGSGGLMGRVEDRNAFSRLFLWSNVVELVAQKPLWGWGWSELAYAHYSTEFSGKRFMELLDNAHNLPLHLAVTLGLPAALAFCGAVSWLIWKNKPWAEKNPERQFAWGALLIIGLHSMVEYPLWYGPFFMTAVLCVGILCAPFVQTWLCAQGAEELAVLRRTWFDRARYGVATALLLGTALVAFDYHRVSQIYLQPEERSRWYAADPLGAAQKSIFFQGHARFALLMSTPLSRENATLVFDLSQEVIHFSPEPRVIERLIDAAVMLGKDDVAAFHLKRYKAAYPREYAAFIAGQ